jgi:dCMP deaminase
MVEEVLDALVRNDQSKENRPEALSMFELKSDKRPPRPSWDEYFMDVCDVVATRSTCLRRNVGAVLVKNKHILATGYNGAPRGIENCLETGKCLRDEMRVQSGERHELCRGAHAEQNAIAQAAYHGIKIKGSTLYCTNLPCIICTKMLINSGIQRIVFKNFYPDDLAVQMLNESKIELVLYTPKETKEK